MNRTADTKLVLEALNEIEKIVRESKLEQNQGDSAQDYAPQDIYTGLIEKLATKVSDPTVLSFIQTTTLAMTQMDRGDVDKLNELIQQLRADLQKYLGELADDDKDNEKAHADKNTALLVERGAAEDTLSNDKDTKTGLEGKLGDAKTNLKKLDAELVELQEFLADLLAEQTAQGQKCQDLSEAYTVRAKDRTEELETLKEIEKIIEEKLDGTPDHIVQNIDEGIYQ